MSIHHGDLDTGELSAFGLDLDTVVDFSVCVNPYGPSPRVRAALSDVALSRYPDRQANQLRRALAGWLGTTPARILAGNGTSELIWLTCLAFLRPRDRVLVPEPTYGEYARAAVMMQARIVPVPTFERDGFILDPKRMRAELRAWQPRVAFVCNPNNPTGTLLPAEQIAGWAEEFPECLFAVDEAYLPFCDGVRSVLDHERDNILVLRSMTKDFALAGLRLGFAVGTPERIERLAAVQPPWSVNAMSQAAGVAALQDIEHVRASLAALRDAKDSLSADLRKLGLAPLSSAAHFFLVQVGLGSVVRKLLLQRGLAVRNCESFGLPSYIRIAPRRPEENARLVQAMAEVLR